MKNKNDIDLEVASEFGIARKKVATITQAFLERIQDHLIEEQEVQLPSFGRFKVVIYGPSSRFKLGDHDGGMVRVDRKVRVCFRKAVTFKRRIHDELDRKENTMDKYAVDEQTNQQDLEKRASQGCPKCGTSLEKHGSVVMCPIHGTEPFEGSQTTTKADGQEEDR